MSRKGGVPKREVHPDHKYNDQNVSSFINSLMSDGKKSKAEAILYGAFDLIGEKLKTEPIKVFKKAFDNVRPSIEVRSRRVGGATYQVPVEVRPERKTALTIRWIVGYARARSERGMAERLAAEIIDASNGRGGSVKKKEDVHRMAEANRAFAHYRW
ncbi:MAG: 30S ribosomal protein S7 [Thermodesulfobacteriota bacterium]